MVLVKELLTPKLMKSRFQAVELLRRLAQAGGLKAPTYEFEMQGTPKKPKHFCKVQFKLPDFLRKQTDFIGYGNRVSGAGRCSKKAMAKKLAALEAVHRLEEFIDMRKGDLFQRLDEFEKAMKQEKQKVESTPIEQELTGVSWENIPIDSMFNETDPASRKGYLEFSPELFNDQRALAAAKGLILTSRMSLPKVVVHENQGKEGMQCFANITTDSRRLEGAGGVHKEKNLNLSIREAEILALNKVADQIKTRQFYENKNSSFGMAKLFVRIPKHQFEELRELLKMVKPKYAVVTDSPLKPPRIQVAKAEDNYDDNVELNKRQASLRQAQKKCPLPVDKVESEIPYDAAITIVRGGTGSGKTTRYPLMLSLFSPTGKATKVYVAQPRRLACQTVARRVASEQRVDIGRKGSHVGYIIRFEAFPASAQGRTIDFMTPGVLLRQASHDPLFRDVTHLCIDEVHERNADMDLLLALAKEAQIKRAKHPQLPPLQLILMSATLDTEQWESYFKSSNGDSPNIKVVDIPEERRFPIDVVHIGEKQFPILRSSKLLEGKRALGEKFDENLCQVAAELAVHLFYSREFRGGSILCFLPGIEEIRQVDRIIQYTARRNSILPQVKYLHSSLNSDEQAQVFVPGNKIILSTNMAETSVTIPDVEFVIDPGRERQNSLIDSTSMAENATVVASQLATVDISRAAAKQRSGRAGRVSPGICYRLYTKTTYEENFEEYTKPEMLRMDITQLVLYSLILYEPDAQESFHPLHLLLNAPDPPSKELLKQSLTALSFQGLVNYDLNNADNVTLTPLGKIASSVPASPHIGRMLMMGFVLRAVDPAFQIAGLLSVPKVFSWSRYDDKDDSSHTSDIVKVLELYRAYLESDEDSKRRNPKRFEFQLVTRIEKQLRFTMKDILESGTKIRLTDEDWAGLNANSGRVAALAALICCATRNIAHLVHGHSDFASRDVPGQAKIHPSSVNFSYRRRAHWYVYHELRTTKSPYMHITTAVSPLEVALFAEASEFSLKKFVDRTPRTAKYRLQGDDWLFVADQWVPVSVTNDFQKDSFLKLRRLLTFDFLQEAAQNPKIMVEDATRQRIMLFVLSMIEQQRIKRKNT